MKDRPKLYLDTKYWALLRDVRLGKSDYPNLKQLLAVLESRVADGSIICPLNADIYFEVMKLSDPMTLMATAKLIDDLSLGLCMIPLKQRVELEVFHFVESSRKPADEIHELVWTKTTCRFIETPIEAHPNYQDDFAEYSGRGSF